MGKRSMNFICICMYFICIHIKFREMEGSWGLYTYMYVYIYKAFITYIVIKARERGEFFKGFFFYINIPRSV